MDLVPSAFRLLLELLRKPLFRQPPTGDSRCTWTSGRVCFGLGRSAQTISTELSEIVNPCLRHVRSPMIASPIPRSVTNRSSWWMSFPSIPLRDGLAVSLCDSVCPLGGLWMGGSRVVHAMAPLPVFNPVTVTSLLSVLCPLHSGDNDLVNAKLTRHPGPCKDLIMVL